MLSWAMPMVFFLPLGVETSTKEDDDADFAKDILSRLLFDYFFTFHDVFYQLIVGGGFRGC